MPFEPIRIYFSDLRSSAGVRQAIARVFTDWTTCVIEAVRRLHLWVIAITRAFNCVNLFALTSRAVLKPENMSSNAEATQRSARFVYVYASFYRCFQSFQSLFGSLDSFRYHIYTLKGWVSGWCIARLCFYLLPVYLKKTTSSFGENNIINTKLCMSSHNKRIIILIYTKDCSDTEGYKSQTNFVTQKMAASEVLSAQCINRTLVLQGPMMTSSINKMQISFW